MNALPDFLAAAARLTDEALNSCLPPESETPSVLHRAMRYCVFAGGKRLRPALAIAGCRIAGGSDIEALPAACALELIHTYSLIHDDLPAMDDDDFRRGKPSCHKAFGEAVAILAGDALLTLAFEVAAGGVKLATSTGAVPPLDAERTRAVVNELASAAGCAGMVGGQTLDILAAESGNPQSAIRNPQSEVSLRERVRAIHELKTMSLIKASLRAGANCAGAGTGLLDQLGCYGELIGLAFQITDDVLDMTSTREELGKSPGKDSAEGKLTWPRAVGLDKAVRDARELAAEARTLAEQLGPEASILAELADFVVERRK